jgi:enoyl-CoA hydratase/carnithine racemase
MTDDVIVEDTDGIRILTINRPSRRNALNANAY